VPAISTTPQALDSTRAYRVNAKRPDGSAYAFAGDEALACAITAIGGGPPLATPDIAPLVPSAGTLTVTVRASQVAGLSPGTYGLDVTATPASGVYAGEPLSVWSGTIALEAAASAAVATPGWTVLKLELALTRKRRAWLSACEMDFAASGHNLDLAGPIAQAIRFAGGTVSDPVRPADAELATVPADSWDAVLDVADYRSSARWTWASSRRATRVGRTGDGHGRRSAPPWRRRSGRLPTPGPPRTSGCSCRDGRRIGGYRGPSPVSPRAARLPAAHGR
jgi:hypothetical protein